MDGNGRSTGGGSGMNEPAQTLHNMSTPPKSVVKYTGLSGARVIHDGVYGQIFAFRLAEELFQRTPTRILKNLGIEPGPEPEKTLADLIEKRAGELSLPDACVVVQTKLNQPCPWSDPLAVLAIITKSSRSVWLRSKAPRLSAIEKRSVVSLLIPPIYVPRMKEPSK